MTDKDNSDKQKDIDDVLMSLDSLLSNAQDSQLNEPVANGLNTAKPQTKSKKTIVNNTDSIPTKSRATTKPLQASRLDVNTKANLEPVKQPAQKQLGNLHIDKINQAKKIKLNNYPLKKTLSFIATHETAMQLIDELPILDDIVSPEALKTLSVEFGFPKKEQTPAKPKTLDEEILHCAQQLFSEQSVTDEQWVDFSQQIKKLLLKYSVD